MQRRRIEKHPHAGQERQQKPAGQPEAVEHRQRVEQMVGRAEIDPRRELAPVGEQIGVAQHDPFRRAFRARGEQDRRRIGGGDAEPAVPRAGETRRDSAVELVGKAERRAQILEPDDLDRPRPARSASASSLASSTKRREVIDEAQPGGAAGRQHGVDAGGMVEHRRDAAGRLQREKGDAGADRVRQHQPDRLAALGAAREPAAEHQAGGDRRGRR